MFTAFETYSLVALVLNLVIGTLAVWMNPRRRVNRSFAITTVLVSLWLLCFASTIFTDDPAWLRFLMYMASNISAFCPIVFDMLRHAIMHDEERRDSMRRLMTPWVFLVPLVILAANNPHHIVGVETSPHGMPIPVYGPGQYLYAAVFASVLAVLFFRFVRSLRRAGGIQRVELTFTVLAAAVVLLLGLTLAQAVPRVTGNRDLMQFLPLCSVVYTAIVMYGIVTQRIMSVGEVLRRTSAYLLVACYLALLYLAVLTPLRAVMENLGHPDSSLPHLAAALVVAFSLAPANGLMQRVANRLFISIQTMDVRTTVQQAQELLTSIGTVRSLLDRFAGFLARAAGTDHVLILMMDEQAFTQQYPVPGAEPARTLPLEADLAALLRDERRPVSVDLLRRLRPTPRRQGARRQLAELGAVVAVGIQAKGAMEGILLLGRRLSGKIYGSPELDALQIIGGQFAVAVENARLYTPVQYGKIYNDILLDSLVSGVVAVNANRRITVFNSQAQAITGLGAEAVVGQPLDTLPEAVRQPILTTLDTGESVRDRDGTLVRAGGDAVPIRISSATFHGHTGERLGALALLTDMTTLKRMEEQIRRSDRLSSLGTLAAGMAHEIKNPLVSIKTFTQLLPQQYQDEEFRRTFSSLVAREVARIDILVTRLLHFARPARASLVPIGLHTVLEDAVRLLEQQTRRHAIRLEHQFRAGDDRILGDADLLSQAFVNFILNAVEAMPEGGTLTISTDNLDAASRAFLPALNHQARRQLRVRIRDTGVGIAPENVARIFDPFFTTKSNGTGLGLSVSHGIIQEHGATMEVQSEPGRGTTFTIQFPLAPSSPEVS